MEERHINWISPAHPLTQGQIYIEIKALDWKSNLPPLGPQDDSSRQGSLFFSYDKFLGVKLPIKHIYFLITYQSVWKHAAFSSENVI